MARAGDALPRYLDLVARIQETLLPRTYLEIGVEFGTSLRLTLPGTRSIGVDPEPKIRHRIGKSARVFPMTSDDFFAEHNVKQLFDGRPVDLAYIDGLHLFEFALRDFMNVESVAAKDSVILIDDSYPPDARSAERDRSTSVWAGDVWKVVLCLIEQRPDLEVSTVDVAPTGVTVVRQLDPDSTVLADRYDELCERYGSMTFTDIEDRKAEALHRVPADWSTIRALLPPRPYRVGDVRRLKALRAFRPPTAANARWRAGQVARRTPAAPAIRRLRTRRGSTVA